MEWRPHVDLQPGPEERTLYARAIRASSRKSGFIRSILGAAADRDPRALYSLATFLTNGVYGFPTEHAAGFRLLVDAAAGGVREAMFDIGVAHDLGRGATEDPCAAFWWYARAAMRGDKDGALQLANCHASGSGTEVDHACAAAWYELAAKLDPSARPELDEYRAWTATTGLDWSPEEIRFSDPPWPGGGNWTRLHTLAPSLAELAEKTPEHGDRLATLLLGDLSSRADTDPHGPKITAPSYIQWALFRPRLAAAASLLTAGAVLEALAELLLADPETFTRLAMPV